MKAQLFAVGPFLLGAWRDSRALDPFRVCHESLRVSGKRSALHSLGPTFSKSKLDDISILRLAEVIAAPVATCRSKQSSITVCYNSANTLERTLRSVAAQEWTDIEHIVIDGGSTDGSIEILDAFQGQLAKVVSEPDRGIFDAMNKGITYATGDVICFLNSDDYYASTNVLSMIAKTMQTRKLDALMGDVGFFHEKMPQRMVRRYRSDRFTPERLAWGWIPAHPALFLHRNVMRRVGGFKHDYRIAGDFEFIIRAFHGHSLRYEHIPEVLVHMQTGGASTSGWRSKVILNQEVLRACRENGLKTNMLKILSKYPLKLLEIFFH